MLSFIVPAHNEQSCLGRTLQAINDTALLVGQPYEMIVVDDASTDGTAEVAHQHGALVQKVNHRQIAATRNAGGRLARGDRLFFVDADTTINGNAVKSALRWMDKGAIGGGAPARFEGSVPLYGRLLLAWLVFFMRLAGLSGGAFMFCTREAFHAVGGFDERLFGAEDAAMSSALKREGRFVVLNQSVLTSGRRVRSMSGLQMLLLLLRIAISPSRMLRRRASVETIWYDSNREADEKATYSLIQRLSNGIALVVVFLLITLPLWVMPWPDRLLNGPLGYARFGARILLAHAGLALWPCSVFLLRSLIEQKRPWQRIKTAFLAGLSLWFAFDCTHGAFRFWSNFLKWILK